MNSRFIAEQVFLAGVESVIPAHLIPGVITLNGDDLFIQNLRFSLSRFDNIYVIGAGKASAAMAFEIEKVLGSRITAGHIVVKYGHDYRLKYIKVTEAGHPVPDSNGFKATESILKIAHKANGNDLVLCLLSGGGSSLLTDFPAGSSMDEIMTVNDLLVKSGACIKEINAVRKHLSSVKGGQLARTVYPATLVSLILSDVTGDPPDVISSGPTCADPTTFSQAIEVLVKYNLTFEVPTGILKHLRDGEAGMVAETPKYSDAVFERTTNLLIGTNRVALEAARLKTLEYNINPLIIDDQLQGDTSSVAEYIVETALSYQKNEDEIKPVCLLFGGETTINMTGKGKGGRNQHLALKIAMLLKGFPGITVLSAGTDGNDGPTDAAGAVVDSGTISGAIFENIDPDKFLNNFDSYHFFKKAGGHIITGPTMTNVMDILVVIVE
jgi:hydroxypyruvate reductase/glycerate 2-kinase